VNVFAIKERIPVIITAVVLIALTTAAGMRFENFVSMRVLMNLLSDNAFLGVVAIGMTFVILTGGIDLSVGSMVGLSSIMVAKLISSGQLPPVLCLFLPMLTGGLLGLGHGFLISRFSLPPFLVTLAGLFLCKGVALQISKESVQINDKAITAITSWSLPVGFGSNLTAPAVIFLFVLVIAIFGSQKTRFGRTVYAIGGNAASARLMGLPVSRTIILTYVLSGMCAGLGGVLFSLYTSSGNAIGGIGLELDAIAAVVIGGTLLTGGYGSMFGTLLGILTIGIVQTAIIFDGTLSSWWTKIVIGSLLLAFMLVQRGIEFAARKTAAA
jgi:simple sugar transport system permease protein